MASRDGRTAAQPYRVRVGGVWYWVDPTVPQSAMEPGDIIIVYPVSGDPVLAILQQDINAVEVAAAGAIGLSSLEGERFALRLDDIAALHLTAVDEVQ
jgi:hypothetical protein